jgi:hypothetical protein
MSTQHSGNYPAKHPPDIKVEPAIMDRVAASIVNGAIACKIAHSVAVELNVAPNQVGIAIDLHNARIKACQLGLFGYGKGNKIVAQNQAEAKAELSPAIRNELVDGKLSCAAAWRVADASGMTYLEIGQACESLGIKINQCQLGAF